MIASRQFEGHTSEKINLTCNKSVPSYTPPQKSGQDFAPSQVENVIMRRFY
jgi:hypothetical protein